MRKIPVKDRNGDEFSVHEYEERRLFRTARRFVLCTGEAVELRGGKLVIASTGEALARIG